MVFFTKREKRETWDGIRVTIRGDWHTDVCSPALRAVDFAVQTISTLPFKIYDRETEERFRGIDLLFNNSKKTSVELFSELLRDFYLLGEGFLLLTNDDENPTGFRLENIPAHAVVYDFEGEFYTVNDTRAPDGRVIRFSFYPLDNPIYFDEKISDISTAWKAQTDYTSLYYRFNGDIPHYIERPANAPTEGWDKEARENFQRSLSSWLSRKGSLTVPVFEDGMKPTGAKADFRTAQVTEMRADLKADIYATLGLHKSMIASETADAVALTYTSALAPVMKLVSETVEARIFPIVAASRRLACGFDYTARVAGSQTERQAALELAGRIPVDTDKDKEKEQ